MQRSTIIIPFYTSSNSEYLKQVLLNIVLFVPLGYFLLSVVSKTVHPKKWLIISALVVSAMVELVQFFAYRGMLDVNDLISNVIGALIGSLLWEWTKKQQLIMSVILLSAGLVGCIFAAVTTTESTFKASIIKQFAFEVDDLTIHDGKVTIEGRCFLYGRTTPPYIILLGDKKAKTDICGDKFTAESYELDDKTEVRIRFNGYTTMPTGIWINGNCLEYVCGTIPIIQGVPETAALKSWDEEHDFLVYQYGNSILWLIGKEIERNSEVIYHIHTDEPELLPENRRKYGFDNRGFLINVDKNADYELKRIGKYRVFKQEIPDSYRVTAIAVGLNTKGTVIGSDIFRINSPNS